MRNMNDPYNLLNDGYLVSDEIVTKMARDYSDAQFASSNVRGAYLRVLVAHSKEALGNARRPTTEQALKAVADTHTRLYAVVLAAITTPDVEADEKLSADERRARALERNRRSTFARSAKSTLTTYIRGGGKLQLLVPEEVTKEALRRESEPVERDKNPATRAEKLEAQLEAAVKEMAAMDRDDAQAFVEEMHEKLLQLVAKPLTQRPMKRGELTFHPAH